MVIYPDSNLGTDDWDDPRYVSSCETARRILQNSLNSSVTYRIDDMVYMRVVQTSRPHRPPVVRNYNVQRNIGEWAIRHYESTIPMPNSQCPICGELNTIEEYTGNTILNITCDRCVNEGYPDAPPLGTIFFVEEDDSYDNYMEEKVNWLLEGF